MDLNPALSSIIASTMNHLQQENVKGLFWLVMQTSVFHIPVNNCQFSVDVRDVNIGLDKQKF